METVIQFGQSVLVGLGLLVSVALCVVGLILSCISLSGTWLVVLATLLLALVLSHPFPGVWTIVGFVALSFGTEVLEFFAGYWGVKKQGGSSRAGLAALIGGLLGLFLGSAIPVPLFGSVIGMLIGSFALVFVVERRRLKKDDEAAQIALGTVIARCAVIFLKVGVTLGMIVYLIVGLI